METHCNLIFIFSTIKENKNYRILTKCRIWFCTLIKYHCNPVDYDNFQTCIICRDNDNGYTGYNVMHKLKSTDHWLYIYVHTYNRVNKYRGVMTKCNRGFRLGKV